MTPSYKWRHRSKTILLTGPSRQFVGIVHLSQSFLSQEVHRPIPDILEMDIPEIENEIEVEVCKIWCIVTRTNTTISLEGPEDPHLRNSRFRLSRDHAHASIPLAQTPWALTVRAWLQAGAQRVVIVVLPPLKSLGIDSCNDDQSYHPCKSMLYQPMMQQSISWKKLHIDTPDKPM